MRSPSAEPPVPGKPGNPGEGTGDPARDAGNRNRRRDPIPRARASSLVLGLSILIVSAISLPCRSDAAELFLAGEPEVYAVIDKLNALGYFRGFLANTRPYSAVAVRSTVDKAVPATAFGRRPAGFPGEMIEGLAAAVAPKRAGAVGVGGSYSDDAFVPPNNEGVPVPGGWSAQAFFQMREDTNPYVSAHVRASYTEGEGSEFDDAELLAAALEVGAPYLSLQAGQISGWYGPGRHGALILSNNAKPFPGVRLHNPLPIPVKGFFSFLGSVQYDFFVGWLDGDRPVPHSQLMGLRLASRPSTFLELGLTTTMHFGGNHPDAAKWYEFFQFSKDRTIGINPNKHAGYDITLNLPFRFQPLQLYVEAVGEDQGAGSGIQFPTKWGYVSGLFLPSIGPYSRFDLRAEFASNHLAGKGEFWYVHFVPGGGYPHRYKGQVLGHPMGTDAENFFVAGRCWIRPSAYLQVDYDYTKRYGQNIPEAARDLPERLRRYSASLAGRVSERVRAEATVAYGSVERTPSLAETNVPDGLYTAAFLSWMF